jgi:hypothetical protein
LDDEKDDERALPSTGLAATLEGHAAQDVEALKDTLLGLTEREVYQKLRYSSRT